MASPGDKKGQRKGSCGHIMASFGSHNKCARCWDKRIGEDNCVLDKPCSISDSFSDSQKELLATPAYRIRKEKKAGLLVSPKDVMVISSSDNEPTFQLQSGPSAQPSTPIQPTMASSSSAPNANFVTSEQFIAMSDKWAEQFARTEALLSHGNIFSNPVSTVKPVDSQRLISETPFMPPATRPTGLVKVPVAVEASVKPKTVEPKVKDKKKSHKSRKTDDSVEKDAKTDIKADKRRDSKSHKKRDRFTSPVPKHSTSTKQGHSGSPPAVTSSGPDSAKQPGAEKVHIHQPSSGSEKVSTGPTSHTSSASHQLDYGHFSTGACAST